MSEPRTPNIVLIHWHDLGRHLGTYGARSVTSPVLDALAASGVRFDQAYCTSPLCSPARGSIFTGRYPHSHGLMGLAHRGWSYAPGIDTLPAILQRHGWRTALVGFQHESSDASTLGYAETIGTRNPDCGPASVRARDWLSTRTADEPPFFLTVGFQEVHRPYPTSRYEPDDPATVVVPDFLPDNEWTRDDLAAFQGAIRTADAAVGTILQALENPAIRENTWVVFTTDHGMAFPGAKSTLYDPGIGVSLIMRPPTGWATPLGPTNRMFSHVDLVPTVLEQVGLPVPVEVQGVSHVDWLNGRSDRAARTEIFAEKNFHEAYDPIRTVRTDRYSYLVNYEERPMLVLPSDLEFSATRYGLWAGGDRYLENRPEFQLFDLREDPLQRHNLAEDAAHAEIRADLAQLLADWQKETDDPILRGPIPASPVPREARFGAYVPPFRPAGGR